ncbi:MAG: hypothetical protein AAB331_04685, partial [Planctomycetota bacterium]
DLGPTIFRNEMQRVIKEEITRGFDVFRKDTGQAISQSIQETFNRFTKRSNDIIREFKADAEILFGVTMDQAEFAVELMKDNGFYYMVQEYTAPTEEEVKSILRTLLPKSMSRKMVFHEMMERVPSDVGRNCGRTRSDLTTRIGKTIGLYAKQLKGLGIDLIAQIEQAIQKGQDRRRAGEESVRVELHLLANKANKLEAHKERLTNIGNAINPVGVKQDFPGDKT